MNASTISIITFTVLFGASLAGCTNIEDPGPFILLVMNETDYDLDAGYFHEGNGAGVTSSPARTREGSMGGANFGCPDRYAPSWNFTLEMRHDYGVQFGGEFFAKRTHTVSCDYYTAWVHPDGYILFEKGRALQWKDGEPVYQPPPWER